MSKHYLNPDTLFPSQQYGFSQIVSARGARLVFISGQVGWNAHQEMEGRGELRSQTWQALRNVQTAVEAAGGEMADVVSLRIYIVAAHMAASAAVSEGLLAFFPPDRLPTTTWIGVPALANPDFLIEIEPIVVLD